MIHFNFDDTLQQYNYHGERMTRFQSMGVRWDQNVQKNPGKDPYTRRTIVLYVPTY